MPVLKNARQEKFCQELTRGVSKTEAARRAGYKDNKFLVTNACKLLKKDGVADRIRELKEEMASLYIKSKEEILIALGMIIRDGADNNIINACKLAAQIQGYLENTINIKNTDIGEMTDTDLVGFLNEDNMDVKEAADDDNQETGS